MIPQRRPFASSIFRILRSANFFVVFFCFRFTAATTAARDVHLRQKKSHFGADVQQTAISWKLQKKSYNRMREILHQNIGQAKLRTICDAEN